MLFLLPFTACGTLPGSGPQKKDALRSAAAIINSATPEHASSDSATDYIVINVDGNTIETISQNKNSYKPAEVWPEEEPAEIIKVNIGDTVQITIYEAQSGGLFIPREAGVRPGNFITLPPQTVENSGYITVPYVGLVKAAGRTTVEIGNTISSSLSNRAIEPQVVVSFTDRRGSEVSVIGAVEEATRFELGFNGDRILDAVASAGGPSAPGYETWISLQRSENEYTISFDELILKPQKNIFVKSDDTIYLYRQAKTFSVYGAASSQGSLAFGKRHLFLSEALGLANGLSDTQADPAEIYIYRHEEKKFVSAMANKETQQMLAKTDSELFPVIYKVNLREPQGFFMAQKFLMQDEDVVYVANAESVEFLKFLNIINSTATTATNTKATKNAY